MTDIRQQLAKDEMLNKVVELVSPAIFKALHSSTRTCLTCDKFQESNELCRQYNMRPPARIIAFGCDDYENEIPF